MTVTVQQTGLVGMVIVLAAILIIRVREVVIAVTMETLSVGVVNVMMIGTMLP